MTHADAPPAPENPQATVPWGHDIRLCHRRTIVVPNLLGDRSVSRRGGPAWVRAWADRSQVSCRRRRLCLGPAASGWHAQARLSPVRWRPHRGENSPHEYQIIGRQDIPLLLQKFEEEYEASTIHAKIRIDTTDQSTEQALEEFLTKARPHLASEDLLRIMENEYRRR